MRLIGLALILTVSLVLTPLAIESQQRGTVPRIGIISALTREGQMPLADAFHEGLQNLGYVEGRNIAIEWQYTDGQAERFAEGAAELVRLKVDIILAPNNPAVVAALTATKTSAPPCGSTNAQRVRWRLCGDDPTGRSRSARSW